MLARVDDWLSRLIPGWCLFCGLPAARGRLCGGCTRDLPWLARACQRCSAPLPAASAADLCARCDLVMRSVDRVHAAVVYEYPVDHLVAAAKFQRRADCAYALGEILARSLVSAGAVAQCDIVVPVPLHPIRLARRGYNQAELVGEVVARALGVTLQRRLCRRRRHTRAQSRLSGGARRVNVRGAFTVRGAVAGRTVAIVDDVITTGHTISALASALRRAGAAGVRAWCAARVVAGQGARKM